MAEYIEFEPPAGYEPPEGVEVNQDFDVVGTFRVKPDGSMCLLAVGGLPVSPLKSQAPEKTTGKGFVDAFKSKQPDPMAVPWDQPGPLGV